MSSKFNSIIIGSRPSRLAIVQAEEIASFLAQSQMGRSSSELKSYSSKGDQDQKTSLMTNPAEDFFTDALDQALLDQEIDIAVHSAKDLPRQLRDGLEIFALTAPLDETDAFVGKTLLSQLPAGARVGTSSLLRKEGILKINPHVQIKDIRGTIEERLQQLDSGAYDGVIVATCALKRLKLEHRITEILPWEATPLQGQLAVVGQKKDWRLKKLFKNIDVRRSYGRIWLVGAGPGDPELITVKATRLLQHADCVFYDYLAHRDLLEYAWKAEKIDVGKRKGLHTLSQSELSHRLKEKAMEGKKVVRLKGGDPLIFGRGGDEIEYLRSYHIEVEVVPGISSATGIPSSLGIPLTARGISGSVAFLSGHHEDEKEESSQRPLTIPDADTLIFLMGLTKLSVIVKSLQRAKWPHSAPMMIISKGTRSDEKILTGTLKNIEELVKAHPLEPPALIIAGDVVKFWERYSYRENHILYLGTNPEKYRPLGHIIHHPMIEITPSSLDRKMVEEILAQLPTYDMVLLTSRFAVRYFFDFLQQYDRAFDMIKTKKFAVIGDDTAYALQQRGLNAHILAEEETSEGMFEVLKKQYSLRGKKILFPRSSLPNPYLKENLTKEGCEVTLWPIYENRKPARRPLPAGPIDQILFTSPSTVRNFLEDYKEIPAGWEILAKGSTTQKALTAAGYESEIIATFRGFF
ncbi:MAG: uroporphyrinogen-III C-methyltransferase [Candidatus Omnitrophica bacterium]|nr:uroporphyrinogen-III C-methyltransferase [Candidatus Omnitrophota bacterium]